MDTIPCFGGKHCAGADPAPTPLGFEASDVLSVPEGQTTIARRFNAGFPLGGITPEGTAEWDWFRRPFGTRQSSIAVLALKRRDIFTYPAGITPQPWG